MVYKANKVASLLMTAAVSALILGACASSGSSTAGPSFPPPPPPVSPPTAPPPPPPPPPPVSNPSDFETAEYNRNYALGIMGASTAYAAGATGEGIVVAVIDSGVLPDHIELTGQISADSIDIVDRPLAITDTDGHGTLVSGVIAGIKNDVGIHGIAFNSTILAIRANDRSATNPKVDDCGEEDEGCNFNDNDIAAAIDYAVDNGAKIINMSLGGGKANNAALDAALARAVNAGVIIVASAGNGYLIDHDDDPDTPDIPDPSGAGDTPDAPANFAGTAAALGRALAAGATDQNNVIASFSNRAGTGNTANFFLVAPGVDIITPGLDPDNPDDRDALYRTSGTSFSSPYIAGALALLLEAFPNLQPEAAVALLVDTATDLGDPGVDPIYGAGLVNLVEAFTPQGTTSASLKGSVVPININDIFAAPSGGFGDWAEKGGAFMGLVFEDKYNRQFTASRTQEVRALARGVGLLESHANSQRRAFSRSQFAIGTNGKLGFGDIAVRQDKLWKDTYTYSRDLDDPMVQLIDNRDLDTEMDLSLHIGRFHFGTGSGLSSSSTGSLSSSPASKGGAVSLIGDSSWVYGGYDLLDGLRMGVVTNTGDYGQLSALNLETRFGAHMLSGELGFVSEDERTLGSSLLGRFGGQDQGEMTYYALNWSGPLIDKWHAQGRVEYAESKLNSLNTVDILSQPSSTAWSVSLSRPVTERSNFKFDIYQPLRAESGAVSLGVPVSFDTETQTYTYEDRTLSLTPSGREFNLKGAYSIALDYGMNLTTWAHYVRNPQHIAGAKDEQIGWVSLNGRW